MDDESFAYNEKKALSANEYTREGHTFQGWATSADATKPEYADKTKVMNLSATDGDTITLYAVWDIETHKATLAGGTTRVDEETGHIISVATYEGGTVTIDSEAIEPGFTLSRDAVKIEPAEGYYLKGWYVTINGVTTYYEDPDAIFNIIMDADVVFEPVWGNYAEDEAARLRAMPQNTLANTGDPIEALPFAIIAIVALIALVVACRKLRSRDE